MMDDRGDEDHAVHDLVECLLQRRERAAADARIDEVAAETAAARLPRVPQLLRALANVGREREQIRAPARVVGSEQPGDGAGVAALRVEEEVLDRLEPGLLRTKRVDIRR